MKMLFIRRPGVVKSLITSLVWTLEKNALNQFCQRWEEISVPEGVLQEEIGWKRMVWLFRTGTSLCIEVYYQTDKHSTDLMTAVLTVKYMTVHRGAVMPLSLSHGSQFAPFLESSKINMVINRGREEWLGSLQTACLRCRPLRCEINSKHVWY